MLINWNKIIDDPDCDRVLRDLARTKLAEKRSASNAVYEMRLDPVWKDAVEANEVIGIGSDRLSDAALVTIACKYLLLDENSDGCTRISSVLRRDGSNDVLAFYPKLIRACNKMIRQASNDTEREAIADAHIVLASLRQLQGDPRAFRNEERDFKKALTLRPNDWRIHSAIATMYCKGDQISLSLDYITRAATLVQSKKARFGLLQKKGKLLSNLFRYKEAITCLEQAMIDYEHFKGELMPKEKGHAVVAQYVLCQTYAMSNQSQETEKKMLTHWKEAESKRNELPPDVINQICWDFRDCAQMLVAKIKPGAAALSHRQCCNCHIVSDKIMKCGACGVAVYCSRACQKEAWKAGHKEECSKDKATKVKQRKEQRIPVNKPLIDEFLDPKNLWKKATRLAKNDKPDEAVWNFLIALFMDFALDKPENLKDARKAVDRCSEKGKYIAMVLSMVTHHKKTGDNPVDFSTDILKSLCMDSAFTSCVFQKPNVSSELSEVDKNTFAFGAAHIFRARWISRCFSCEGRTMDSPIMDSSINGEAFQDAADSICKAHPFIDPDQWLTYQYELGYSNFDIGACEQGKTWLKSFISNLNRCKKLSTHWLRFRRVAETKLNTVSMMGKTRDMLGDFTYVSEEAD